MLLKIILLIGLDQITKAYFVSRDFFVPNYGLPFGLDFGVLVNSIIVFFGLIFFFWLFWKTRTRQNKLLNWGFILVLAGALTNLLDRLMFGYVRDFINLGLGFTFNLADIFIVLGLILILFQTKENSL